jgi:hypothetical protein
VAAVGRQLLLRARRLVPQAHRTHLPLSHREPRLLSSPTKTIRSLPHPPSARFPISPLAAAAAAASSPPRAAREVLRSRPRCVWARSVRRDLGVCCCARRRDCAAAGRSDAAYRFSGSRRGSLRRTRMYAPQSSRGAASASAADQPRVYQVWRGSNVSALPPSLPPSLPRFGAVCSRNSGSGSGRPRARDMIGWLARGFACGF